MTFDVTRDGRHPNAIRLTEIQEPPPFDGSWYRASDAVTHYTPEEPDQPACDADVDADAPAVMFGTLNPLRATCPDCRRLIEAEAAS